MLGILRDGNGKTIQILNNLSVDLDHLRKSRNSKSRHPSVETNLERNLHLTRQAERALKTTFLEQKYSKVPLSAQHIYKKRERSNNQTTE
jgi:ATP-dependent Clp protease ATP-binding subunit ClpC